MPALYSEENQISDRLRRLGCSASCFAAIGQLTSHTTLNHSLQGKRAFPHGLAEKLNEVLDEMDNLWRDAGGTIDWTKIDKVRNILTIRRVHRLSRDFGETELMDRAAAKATAAARE